MNNKLQTTIRLDESLLNSIEDVCLELGITRTRMIEQSLRYIIKYGFYKNSTFLTVNERSNELPVNPDNDLELKIKNIVYDTLQEYSLPTVKQSSTMNQNSERESTYSIDREVAKEVYSSYIGDYIIMQECIKRAIEEQLTLREVITYYVENVGVHFNYFLWCNDPDMHHPTLIDMQIPKESLSPKDLITDKNHKFLLDDIDPYLEWK
jgi:hypothetical protein